MDIREAIKKIRALITEIKNLDEIGALADETTMEEIITAYPDSFETLIDYIDMNYSTLNTDKNLKQQIMDCFQLASKQIIDIISEMSYFAHYLLAIYHLLNDDINGLCQSIVIFLEELEKFTQELREFSQAESKERFPYEPWTSDEVDSDIFFFYLKLTGTAQNIFVKSILSVFKRLYPDTAATYYIESLSYKVSDMDEMLDCLSKTLEFDKDFYLALWDTASLFRYHKNWKNAIVYYCKYINSGFEEAYIYEYLAWCYGKIRDYGNAIIAYKKCLNIDPQYPICNSLGYVYEKVKDYDQAFHYYQQSIESGKDGAFPYRNTFNLLKRLKRYDEAIAFWEAHKKRFPKSYQEIIANLQENTNESTQQILLDDMEDEDGIISEPSAPRGSPEKLGNSFLSESRLEAEIEAQINKGLPFCDLPLRMYENSDGYGRQYIIPGIGRIDLLTVNTSNNDLYVIELKRRGGDDEIIGQISRYMGWVKKNLASNGQNVYGIICTSQASDRLKYAADIHPNISIFNYSFQITPA